MSLRSRKIYTVEQFDLMEKKRKILDGLAEVHGFFTSALMASGMTPKEEELYGKAKQAISELEDFARSSLSNILLKGRDQYGVDT